MFRRMYNNMTEKIFEFIKKEKLLNDEEFSAQWVQARMSKYGPIRIARELRMKGIDRDMTGSAIQEVLTEDQELENAVLLAMKKLRTEKTDAEEIKRFQRITSFLVRHGYSWEIARKAYEMALERNQGEDG